MRQADGDGYQSGWGRLLSVTLPLGLAVVVRERAAWHRLGALEGRGVPPPLPMHPCISPVHHRLLWIPPSLVPLDIRGKGHFVRRRLWRHEQNASIDTVDDDDSDE